MQPTITGSVGGFSGVLSVSTGLGFPDAGAVVSARVMEIQDGRAELAVGSVRLSVSVPVPLSAGQEVRLQVVRAAPGQVVLRLVDDSGPAPGAPPSAPALPATPSPARAGAASPSASVPALPTVPHLAGPVELLPGRSAPLTEPGPLELPATSPSAGHSAAQLSAAEPPSRGIPLPPGSGTEWSAAIVEKPPRLSQVADAARGSPLASRVTLGSDAVALPPAARVPGEPTGPLANPRAGGSVPQSTCWRDALAALEALAAGEAPDAPATALATDVLRAWSAESLEAPALARWLRRVIHAVAVPTEAKLASVAPTLTGEGAPLAPNQAQEADPAQHGPPQGPLVDDARTRLALLRTATSEATATSALDRLVVQLATEQARNAAPRSDTTGWTITLPPPLPHQHHPIELRVPRQPAHRNELTPPVRHAIQLRLTLPQLGELVIDLELNSEQTRCRILTTSPFTAALFDATAAELVGGLARAGYPRARVETTVRHTASGSTGDTPAARRVDVRA